MEEKLDAILTELEILRSKFNSHKPTILERIWNIIEKAFIPLVIALIAYYGNSVATHISERQLVLARSTAEAQREEFQRIIQTKYIELFYTEITSEDSRKQKQAIGLLHSMDPELALSLSKLVTSNSEISQDVKAKTEVTKKQIQDKVEQDAVSISGPLHGMKVGIYYVETDSKAVDFARKIQQHLRKADLGGYIQLYPRSS